jgi:hypothetical protein
MSDPSGALQKAIVTALKAAATGVGSRIYDRVPENAAFPYVTIGDAQSIGAFADCYDGTESFIDVHIWSRATNFGEAKTVLSQVRSALHDEELSLDGHILELLNFRDARTLRDPDGLTSHVVATFRALSHPST